MLAQGNPKNQIWLRDSYRHLNSGYHHLDILAISERILTLTRESAGPMRFRQLILLALTSLLGCDDSHSFTPPICTAQFVYGISVDVVDSGSGAPLADSATMTLRDGNYVESATLSPDGLTMNGAGERAGNYTVVVARPRYHNWVRTEVQVDADECHVIPIKLRAELQEISR